MFILRHRSKKKSYTYKTFSLFIVHFNVTLKGNEFAVSVISLWALYEKKQHLLITKLHVRGTIWSTYQIYITWEERRTPILNQLSQLNIQYQHCFSKSDTQQEKNPKTIKKTCQFSDVRGLSLKLSFRKSRTVFVSCVAINKEIKHRMPDDLGNHSLRRKPQHFLVLLFGFKSVTGVLCWIYQQSEGKTNRLFTGGVGSSTMTDFDFVFVIFKKVFLFKHYIHYKHIS